MNIEELKFEIKKYASVDYNSTSKSYIHHMNDIIDNSNDTSIMIGHPNDILFIAMEEIVEFLDAVKNVEDNNYPVNMDNNYLINFAEEFVDVRIAVIKVIRYLGQKYGIEQMEFSYLQYDFCYSDTYGESGKIKDIYADLIKMHSSISKYARMNNYTEDADQIKIISNLLDSCISVYMKMTSVGSTFSYAMINLINIITDIKIKRQRERDTKICKG